MSKQEINKDPYIKSLFEKGGVEEPSSHFTNRIIERIQAQSESSAYQYKPVISKGAWLAIAIIGLGIFLSLLFSGPSSGQGLDLYGYSLNIDLSNLKNLLNKIALSFELTPIFKTAIVALFIFTFSNLIIFELKNRSIFK
jgi:hypothetical protein